MNREHISYSTPQLLADAVAARTLLLANDILCRPDRERVDIALTGGTDGTAILRALAGSPLLDVPDWSKVHLWWGDERFVAANSAERNAVGASDALLDMLLETKRIARNQIHEMPADRRSQEELAAATDQDNAVALAAAAADYQDELEKELGENGHLDIAMFGLGPDGHFASLFPNMPQVGINEPDVLVTGVTNSPKMPPLRLSLTVPMIVRTDYVWVCGSREGKAEAMGLTFHAQNNPALPASYADAVQQVLWITDEAAGRDC